MVLLLSVAVLVAVALLDDVVLDPVLVPLVDEIVVLLLPVVLLTDVLLVPVALLKDVVIVRLLV